MAVLICDIECYINYFLLLTMNAKTGVVYRWEMFNGGYENDNTRAMLEGVVRKNTIVTFNGYGYDYWMMNAFLDGQDNAALKEISDFIIADENTGWDVRKKYGIELRKGKRIDIMPVAPLMAGLKIYAGRIRVNKLQDLPIAPSATIKQTDLVPMREYCVNDLHATLALYDYLQPQLDLRRAMGEQYEMDLVSKSDAQIAEAVIRKKLQEQHVNVRCPEFKPDAKFTYTPPACVKFQTLAMKEMLKAVTETTYELNKGGALAVPNVLRKKFPFKNRMYKMGIGGLHSAEKNQTIRIEPGQYLTDLDVTSYYPQMILNNKLFPAHLTDKFLKVYKNIVDERVAAKNSGDKVTADALKIVINSSFGKFGSQYSALYSPQLLLQTTISGQLYLLMLIERIERNTMCQVVSANTDGITVFSPDEEAYQALMKHSKLWEKATAMNLEAVQYRALFAQDVNNYVAVKTNGEYKGKGIFASASLSKSPQFPIVQKAIIEAFVHGTPVEKTIEACSDVSEFVALRKVGGGAYWRDAVVGSTVRWYMSIQGGPILYLNNHNRVPGSDGAQLVNKLPEHFPNDIDFDAYVKKARALMFKIDPRFIHAGA